MENETEYKCEVCGCSRAIYMYRDIYKIIDVFGREVALLPGDRVNFRCREHKEQRTFVMKLQTEVATKEHYKRILKTIDTTHGFVEEL